MTPISVVNLKTVINTSTQATSAPLAVSKPSANSAPTISASNSSSVKVSTAALNVSNAAVTTPTLMSVAQVLSAGANIPSGTIITDTAINIQNNLDALSVLSNLDSIASITLSDKKAGSISINSTDGTGSITSLVSSKLNFLKKITSTYTLNLNGFNASSALTFVGPNKSATLTLSINDTVENITTNIVALQNLAKSKTLKVVNITKNQNGIDKSALSLSSVQFKSSPELLAVVKGDFNFIITGVLAADALTTAGAADKILKSSGSSTQYSQITVNDTADNISKNIRNLETLAVAQRLNGVATSDNKSVTLTQSSYNANADVFTPTPYTYSTQSQVKVTLTDADAYSANFLVGVENVGTIINNPGNFNPSSSGVFVYTKQNSKNTDLNIFYNGKITGFSLPNAKIIDSHNLITNNDGTSLYGTFTDFSGNQNLFSVNNGTYKLLAQSQNGNNFGFRGSVNNASLIWGNEFIINNGNYIANTKTPIINNLLSSNSDGSILVIGGNTGGGFGGGVYVNGMNQLPSLGNPSIGSISGINIFTSSSDQNSIIGSYDNGNSLFSYVNGVFSDITPPNSDGFKIFSTISPNQNYVSNDGSTVIGLYNKNNNMPNPIPSYFMLKNGSFTDLGSSVGVQNFYGQQILSNDGNFFATPYAKSTNSPGFGSLMIYDNGQKIDAFPNGVYNLIINNDMTYMTKLPNTADNHVIFGSYQETQSAEKKAFLYQNGNITTIPNSTVQNSTITGASADGNFQWGTYTDANKNNKYFLINKGAIVDIPASKYRGYNLLTNVQYMTPDGNEAWSYDGANLVHTLIGITNSSNIMNVSVTNIKDTALKISNNLLNLNIANLPITISDSNPIVLNNANDLKQYNNVFSKINGNYKISLNGISASDYVNALSPSKSAVFVSTSIVSTPDDLLTSIDKLQSSIKTKPISTIRIPDGSNLTLTYAQYKADQDVLKLISGKYTLNITDMAAADVKSIVSSKNITSITIKDTSSNIIKNSKDLKNSLMTLYQINSPGQNQSNFILNVNLTNAANPTMSISDYLTYNSIGFQQLTQQFNLPIRSVKILDTSANILNYISNSSHLNLLQQASLISFSDKTSPKISKANDVLIKSLPNFDPKSKYTVA